MIVYGIVSFFMNPCALIAERVSSPMKTPKKVQTANDESARGGAFTQYASDSQHELVCANED